jgi:FkbM family methyltransferase
MMTLLQTARRLYRANAHRYPTLFNWEQLNNSHVKRLIGYLHEPDFGALRVLPLDHDSLYLDIGANYGQSISDISLMISNPRIVAFEPNPSACRHLLSLVTSSRRLHVHNCALSQTPGSLTLYIPTCCGVILHQNASLTPIDIASLTEALVASGLAFAKDHPISIQAHDVDVRKLDDFSLLPDFVKIDVEGHELDVLKGGIETITRSFPFLLIERGERENILTWLENLSYRRYVFLDGNLIRSDDREALNSFYFHPARLDSLAGAR